MGHQQKVWSIAISGNGKLLATGGGERTVKLWDVITDRERATLKGHASKVTSVAISGDGKLVVSGSEDETVKLWDAATGREKATLRGHTDKVTSVAISRDGKVAASASEDSTVKLWDVATGREKATLKGHTDRVISVAISGDGKLVASGSRALVFSPDGRQLVTASGPHVTVLDWPRMKVRRSFDLPKPDKQPKEYECQKLAISPDGRWLVTVAERSGWRSENPPSPAGGVVDLWDLGTGQHIRRLAEWLKLNWYFQPATMATFTADGQVVLAPGTGTIPAQGGRPAKPSQGGAALLDPLTPRWLRSFASMSYYYTAAIAVSPDGRTLYVSFDTNFIAAFEVATGNLRRTLHGHAGCVRSLAMAPDGRRLLSGSDDAFALLWDTTPAGAAKPRKEPLTAAGADELWVALAGLEAQPAYAAMADLAAAPDRAVALLRRELKPAPAAPTDAELDRAFADLDSEDFATREKASRRLAGWAELAVPGVRKRLEKTESAEVQKRAQDLLDRFDPATLKPDRLRQMRAVELLEGIATPAARDVLSELAKGAAEAPLSRDAAGALERLRRR